eukprot:Platyproteum_vivax@DN8601_c0_g1_i1.p1
MYTPPGSPPMPPSADQQALLQSRFGAVPTSASHIADQMETGGQKIEDTLSRLNCKYQTLFFLAAIGVVFASIIGVFTSLVFFEVANCINCAFLCLFGFVMMILDIPGTPRWAGRYRLLVRKYARLLTRLTGKAMAFLYLGSLVAVSLWPRRASGSRMMLIFLALITSFFVVSVSVIGLLIALRKSLRLEKVRKAIQNQYRHNIADVFRKFAVTDPTHGLQYEEFNRMVTDHTQGRIQFDISDLGIIYNALDEHQKSAINEREFAEWMHGLMTYL